MHRTTNLVKILVAILIAVGVVYAASIFLSGSRDYVEYHDVLNIVSSRTSGDAGAAIAEYRAITADETRSADEKALAEIAVAGLIPTVSNAKSDRLTEVRKLKAIVLDETISADIRAAALSILGLEYNYSSATPEVFTEVYSGAPFDSYLVKDNPELSQLNIEQASYQLYPSTVAAIAAAQAAAEAYFSTPNLSEQQKAQYVAIAEDYLKKADAAFLIDADDNRSYTESSRYRTYREYRAGVTGRLAIAKGTPYIEQYRKEYEDYFAFVASMNNQVAPGVRLQYARILMADKDTEAAKAQLALIVQSIDAYKGQAVMPFLRFLYNEEVARPNGVVISDVKKLAAISPEFKAAMLKAKAMNPQNQN